MNTNLKIARRVGGPSSPSWLQSATGSSGVGGRLDPAVGTSDRRTVADDRPTPSPSRAADAASADARRRRRLRSRIGGPHASGPYRRGHRQSD